MSKQNFKYEELKDENIYLITNFDEKDYIVSIYEALKKLVSNIYETNKYSTYRNYSPVPLDLKEEVHLKYLAEFLAKLKCKMIIGEDNYIDQTYLNDFSRFYVKCFPHYRKTCLRLHFFCKKIEKEELFDKITSQNNDLQQIYLGYSVIKPIPFFVGRTCLKPYFKENDENLLLITQKYNINMFGIPLYVDSLIFHDKDKAVAACAAVSLWICSYITSEIFKTHPPILSLYEITLLAFKESPLLNRMFPNKSLETRQLASVIREMNLEPEYRSVRNRDILPIIYGYLHYKVPIILLIERIETSNHNSDQNKLLNKKNYIEKISQPRRHAVLISGFLLDNEKNYKFGDSNFRAYYIKNLMIHDDQIGPYILSNITIKGDNKKYNYFLKIQDKNNIIKGIVIPVCKEIRVSLDYIIYNEFFMKIEDIISKIISVIDNKIEDSKIIWDIYLTDVNNFKNNIRILNINKKLKKNILFTRYPKYLWRAIFYIKEKNNDNPVFEFQVDATDLPKSIFIFKCFFYEKRYYSIFEDKLISAKYKKYSELIDKISERLITEKY
ncbi:MAG: hypothetical protein ACTSRP_22335 [Candidatus Helarchaeota archaeon]